MRYSSFNWAARGKRGWIFGPFFDRTLTVTLERKRLDPPPRFTGRVNMDISAVIAASEERLAAAIREAERRRSPHWPAR